MVNIMDDCTVVLGIDKRTLGYFAVTNQSWLHFHPWLLTCPWLVFYDGEGDSAVTPEEIRAACPQARAAAVQSGWTGSGSRSRRSRAVS